MGVYDVLMQNYSLTVILLLVLGTVCAYIISYKINHNVKKRNDVRRRIRNDVDKRIVGNKKIKNDFDRATK